MYRSLKAAASFAARLDATPLWSLTNYLVACGRFMVRQACPESAEGLTTNGDITVRPELVEGPYYRNDVSLISFNAIRVWSI